MYIYVVGGYSGVHSFQEGVNAPTSLNETLGVVDRTEWQQNELFVISCIMCNWGEPKQTPHKSYIQEIMYVCMCV